MMVIGIITLQIIWSELDGRKIRIELNVFP